MNNFVNLCLGASSSILEELSKEITESNHAEYVFSKTEKLLNIENEIDKNIEQLEVEQYAPELKAYWNSVLECNKAVIVHLEKFQLHGYHFETLIHAMKLENSTLSEKIHFANVL